MVGEISLVELSPIIDWGCQFKEDPRFDGCLVALDSLFGREPGADSPSSYETRKFSPTRLHSDYHP